MLWETREGLAMFRSVSSGLLNMLFSADGRIGRGEYWLWSILVNLAVLAIQHYVFGFWTLSPVFLDILIARGDESWSLGPLTLPHMLVRLIAAEQLYRAAALLANHPYHRA